MCGDSRQKSRHSSHCAPTLLALFLFLPLSLSPIPLDPSLSLSKMSFRQMHVAHRGFQVLMAHKTHQRKWICAALNRSCPVRMPEVIYLKWRVNSTVPKSLVVSGV